MKDDAITLREKILALFTNGFGERATRLDASRPATEAKSAIAVALTPQYGPEKAMDIAFHLSDWGTDGAFLLALHLFPEQFTSEEIQEGVLSFLIHVPNHVAAAGFLSGSSLKDVFNIGLKLEK